MIAEKILPSQWLDENLGNTGSQASESTQKTEEGVDTLTIHDFAFCATNRPNDDESLLGENWLFRGGWAALIGPTGQGKTSFMIQSAACWALGRPFMGIVPQDEFKILVVQIENGPLDLHEMASGVAEELSLSDDERGKLGINLRIATPVSPSPVLFAKNGSVAKEVTEWKPDLLMIDSLYKWLPKGNAIDAEGLVEFIDRILLPLCKSVNCGALVSHHMGRNEVLRLQDGGSSRLSDLYAGAGGMFVADSARATLLLVPSEQVGSYTLRAAKRGGRIGWRDDAGEKVYEKHLAWAEGHIGWREMDARSVMAAQSEQKRKKQLAQNQRHQDQVTWAYGQVAEHPGDWVERQLVIQKCSSAEGPIPEGVRDTKCRGVINQMVADGHLLQEERKNKNNRNSAFLSKP